MSFQALMAASRPLLADGAMATNLFDAGLRPGDPPEAWTLTRPAAIVALHRRFVEAGADILLTNSFGANAGRLAPHGLQAEVEALNRGAVRLAHAAAAGAGRPIAVAGCIGPTGGFHGADPRLAPDEAERIFEEQTRVLVDAGADLLWLETFGSAEEMRAAARAASRTALPYVLTASFEQAGRTHSGLAPTAFVELMNGLPVAPAAIGVNCGAGPSEALRSLDAIRVARPAMPLAVKPNAGLPIMVDGRFTYAIPPEEMADFAARAIEAGARFIGGCCGTTPAHLAAMGRVLRAEGTDGHVNP